MQLNIPLRITGGFKPILGMTKRGFDPNYTYYEFTMTDRDGNSITTAEKLEDDKMRAHEPDVVPSIATITKIHHEVDGFYKYTYHTKNNLKYLQKVNDEGKIEGTGKKIFIMKDPTNSESYAVEYVHFGEIENTNPNPEKKKTFGVYTVFTKDSGNRSLNSQGGGGNSDDIDSNEHDDDEENEGDVRYANFRRVSKTLRVNKHKHDKASSKRSKTFKKR